MPNTSRRDFLVTAGSFALALGGSARAAMAPDDKFDLVVKGGDVLDPSQSLRGKRDIGMRYGVIEAVEADIPASRALRVLDASGKLVTPGLVDLHCHVFPYGSAIGIPADELVPHQCTTTCVSAGDAGAHNFAAFRRYVVAQTRTRLYAFVHIANMGLAPFPVAELYNIDFAQVDTAAKAVGENADMVLGVKVRMSENVIAKNGLEPLKRAVRACEVAGSGAKVMCHIGGVETAELMSQILDTLRPGDILTHCFSGFPNIAGAFTNIVQNGRLLPAALAAKQRGVIFDVGQGGGRFDFTVAEPAIQQGCPPDTISSDIHVFSGNTPGMPYLPWVMSKFLALGFTLEQVVAMATINPAKVINRAGKLGTLQVGAPGDVAIMELVEGPVSFVDTRNNSRDGRAYLKPVQTVTAGGPFGRPDHSPFAGGWDPVGRGAPRGGGRHLRPDSRAQAVDRNEALRRLQVPEGPAVAGLEPLRQRADAMDGANAFAQRNGAVGAHQRLHLALGVAETRARRDQSTLEQRRERHPRRLARGHERRERGRGQRLHPGDAPARGPRVGRIPLHPDEAAGEAPGHRAGGAGAAERVEHEVVRPRGCQQHPCQQRLRLLRRMQLLAAAVLEPLLAGAERQRPVGARLHVVVAGL